LKVQVGDNLISLFSNSSISITDGQCFLEGDLFNAGVRPAVNVGISVSRVGGAAQIKAMRSVSGTLRLDLSAYRELEAFAAFGSDLDDVSKRALSRGSRLVELLKQPQSSPFPPEREVVSIWAGTSGELDDVEVGDIRAFEAALHDYIQHNAKGIFDTIAAGTLPDETVEEMRRAVAAVKQQFVVSTPAAHQDHADAMGADEVGQTAVTRVVPNPAS